MTISNLLGVLNLVNISEYQINGVTTPLSMLHTLHGEETIKTITIKVKVETISKEDMDIFVLNYDIPTTDIEIVLPPFSMYNHIVLDITVERSK
jgi:hypothetical protein